MITFITHDRRRLQYDDYEKVYLFGVWGGTQWRIELKPVTDVRRGCWLMLSTEGLHGQPDLVRIDRVDKNFYRKP